MSLTLSACARDQAVQNAIVDMHQRLVDFTEINSRLTLNSIDLNAPSKASLRIEVDEMFINLRQFYALDECLLTKQIAERNTALGKTQLPSIRFAYEHKLLAALRNCASQIGEEHRMYAQLSEWTEQKQSRLPVVYANMLSQSTEIYRHFSFGSGFIRGAESDNLAQTRLALQALVEAQNEHVLNLDDLETHLKILDESRLLARMWRTQQLFIISLPQINQLLEQYINDKQCRFVSDRDELRIMRNIFKVFFADKIQSLASELNRYHYQLSPLVNTLAHSPALPSALKDYLLYHSIDAHESYRQSMRNHIQLWQKIFGLCESS